MTRPRADASRRFGLAAATLLTALLVLLSPSPARADDAATRGAKKHYDKADLAYNLARFDDALHEYGLAYEAKPMPEFLFNIAQCHKLLGNYERAILFYESFLRADPDADHRSLAESLTAESRKALSKRDEVARGAAAAHAAPASAAEAALHPAAPLAVAPRPLLRRWWFWTIAGAVAAGGAVALIVGLVAPRERTMLPSGSLGTLDWRN